MYDLVFRIILQRLDPERAHALAQRSLRFLYALPPARWFLRRAVGAPHPSLRTCALGLTFSSPLGVAAGLDKGAEWFEELAALGFGFVEIGTVTARPQEGNPSPRIVRIPALRALLNQMGFPNPGAAVVAKRLRRRRQHMQAPSGSAGIDSGSVVGVNIGKSRAVSLEEAPEDYRNAARALAPHADYLVLNVSSPNTPGLRRMQADEALRMLVSEVRAELTARELAVPLLVKIAPDLDEEELSGVVSAALALELDGIVAVNTTVDRSVLGSHAAEVARFPGGGVSGAPLRPRAFDFLRRIRSLASDRLVLISVGGLEDAEDVWERLLAGATLVQAYSAFVYHGPLWAARINRSLADRVRASGATSLQDLLDRERAARASADAPPLDALGHGRGAARAPERS